MHQVVDFLIQGVIFLEIGYAHDLGSLEHHMFVKMRYA